MNFVAIKMLMGDRAKYLGIILGVSLATMLIVHQVTIFTGLMARTWSVVQDLRASSGVDLIVAHPQTEFLNDARPLADTDADRVRSVTGVDWAVPMVFNPVRARVGDHRPATPGSSAPNPDSGRFRTCIIVGLDDATLLGGPAKFAAGSINDLRRPDAVIIDRLDATKLLSVADNSAPVLPADHQPASAPAPARPHRRPLELGDTIEVNDRRAVVAAISDNTRPFLSQPIIYTTISNARRWAPAERRGISYVLVKLRPGADPDDVARKIADHTGLAALGTTQFGFKTVGYFIRNTGIPVNFGITIILGCVVGIAISGQTFYLFVLDNLKNLAALKAMGAGDARLLGMTLIQALTVGVIGYGLGVGGAMLLVVPFTGTELQFDVYWQILALAAVGIAIVVALAAAASLSKVLRLEPAIVFKG